MAAKSITQDMTQGKPVSLLLKFFFPLLFGMLFQQFYNVVDMAIVGKTLGSENLAAVGATGSVNFLILGSVWVCATDLPYRWRRSLVQKIIKACAVLLQTVCGYPLFLLWL